MSLKLNTKSLKLKQPEGYYHVSHYPTDAELRDYYSKKNYEKRNMIEYYDRDREYYTLQNRLIIQWIMKKIKISPILADIGCGIGHFLQAANDLGVEAEGYDISEDAVNFCKSHGLKATIKDLLVDDVLTESQINTVFCKNVIEHIKFPASLVQKISAINSVKYVVLGAPNDFSSLQEYYVKRDNLEPYWIDEFHHFNYFTHKSIENLLSINGFKPIARFSTFPIEIFQSFGIDYLTDRSKGRSAHLARIEIEKKISNISPDLYIDLLEACANNNMGREALILAERI